VVGNQHDIGSSTAVPTIGTAVRHELLAQERDRAVAASASDDGDDSGIDHEGIPVDV
jgi:hypothetical protein